MIFIRIRFHRTTPHTEELDQRDLFTPRGSGLPGALRPGVAFPVKGLSLQAGHTHTTPEMPSRAALALHRTGREGKWKQLPSSNEMQRICVTLPEIKSSVSPGTLGLPRKQHAFPELTDCKNEARGDKSWGRKGRRVYMGPRASTSTHQFIPT